MVELADMCINKGTPVIEAYRRLDRTAKRILFVLEEGGRLEATLTDGDLRRFIMAGGELSSTIESAMYTKPKVLHEENRDEALAIMKRHSIDALPVIDKTGRLIDAVFLHDLLQDESLAFSEELCGTDVIIMAGGQGTRLYPYTKILPKPLIPIGDDPIVELIMNRFRNYGVNRFILSVNHKKNMIKAYFSEREEDYRIDYVEESRPLGTGGSLYLAKDMVNGTFFVTNCDILIDADYADIYRHHKNSGNIITVVTSLKRIVIPYGVVRLDDKGCLTSINEKPEILEFINTGFYVVEPGVFRYIHEDNFIHMTQLTEAVRADGWRVGTYPVSEDSYLDMGQLDEMDRMKQKLDME